MKEVVFLIGIPYSGKSTYIQNNFSDYELISSDRWIEEEANKKGKTYAEIFSSYVKEAQTKMMLSLKNAIKNRKNIVWDQTNLTPNSRRKKLLHFPKDYKKIAISFAIPSEDVLNFRIQKRTDKFVPLKVIEDMKKQYILPTKEEGFDDIIHVSN